MRLRARAAPWLALALATACGRAGDETGPPTNDAATCAPVLPDPWAPRWAPPATPIPRACIERQMEDLYARCSFNSSGYDATACEKYKTNSGSVDCVSCMFSEEKDPAWTAIVTTEDGSSRANVGGCIALTDGDVSEDGCGARQAASVECTQAACQSCGADTYLDCKTAARDTVCAPYAAASACARHPRYARCTEYASYADYFLAIGEIFCNDGYHLTDAAPGDD